MKYQTIVLLAAIAACTEAPIRWERVPGGADMPFEEAEAWCKKTASSGRFMRCMETYGWREFDDGERSKRAREGGRSVVDRR